MFLAEVNSTLLNELTGKEISFEEREHVTDCIVYFLDRNNRTKGIGVAIRNNWIIVHSGVMGEHILSKIRFSYNQKIAMAREFLRVKRFSLMRVSNLRRKLFCTFKSAKNDSC